MLKVSSPPHGSLSEYIFISPGWLDHVRKKGIFLKLFVHVFFQCGCRYRNADMSTEIARGWFEHNRILDLIPHFQVLGSASEVVRSI